MSFQDVVSPCGATNLGETQAMHPKPQARADLSLCRDRLMRWGDEGSDPLGRRARPVLEGVRQWPAVASTLGSVEELWEDLLPVATPVAAVDWAAVVSSPTHLGVLGSDASSNLCRCAQKVALNFTSDPTTC